MYGHIYTNSPANTKYQMLVLGEQIEATFEAELESHIDIRHNFPRWILEIPKTENYFIKFVQEYYDWLYIKSGYELNRTSYHFTGLGKLLDIDTTPNDFLERFSYSYAPGLSSLFKSKNITLGVRSFLKGIRENLYQRKSNEGAYRYFFQSLFNSDDGDILISYPKESIFRLNGGRFDGWSDFIFGGAKVNHSLGGSFLNSGYILQDSDWYQDFSYLIKAGIDVVDENTGLPEYYEELTNTLHPAGLKGFFEKTVDDYIPPPDADGSIIYGEVPKLGNYFAYRLNSSVGYTACMGCSGSGIEYDGPTAYGGGSTGGWTSGDAWGGIGNGSISAEYNIPTHNWPDWDDDISSGLIFGGIYIRDFVYLYPAVDSPNLGMTGCTAAGGTGECWA